MKYAVFLLAGAQIAFLVIYAVSVVGSSDAMGNAIIEGFLTLAGIVMAIFLIPALILAINQKALKLAVFLSLVPIALIWALFAFA